MNGFTAHVEGIALWAPTLPGWALARAALRGEAVPAMPPRTACAPAALSAAERRRAPQTVALALTASEEAIRDAGRDASELLAVFCSTHGDLPIIDHLCSTLVHTPLLVSPTRFLHSIHNAPAGLWSMLSRNPHANTAVNGAGHSFANGLLETLVLCEAERSPVLLAAYDTAAVGALTHTTRSEGALAVALVLSPTRSRRTQATLRWRLAQGHVVEPGLRSDVTRALLGNGMSAALPLFESLARGDGAPLAMPLSAHQFLHIEWASQAIESPAQQSPVAAGDGP